MHHILISLKQSADLNTACTRVALHFTEKVISMGDSMYRPSFAFLARALDEHYSTIDTTQCSLRAATWDI